MDVPEAVLEDAADAEELVLLVVQEHVQAVVNMDRQLEPVRAMIVVVVACLDARLAATVLVVAAPEDAAGAELHVPIVVPDVVGSVDLPAEELALSVAVADVLVAVLEVVLGLVPGRA